MAVELTRSFAIERCYTCSISIVLIKSSEVARWVPTITAPRNVAHDHSPWPPTRPSREWLDAPFLTARIENVA